MKSLPKKFKQTKTLTNKRKKPTSLVLQWLRIRLPMQRTQVWSLVWEDPTNWGAPKPGHHSGSARAPEPASPDHWSPRAWSPRSETERPLQREACAPGLEWSPGWLAAITGQPRTTAKTQHCPKQKRINTWKKKTETQGCQATEREGGHLNAYCSVKDTDLKMLHTLWFQLCDLLKRAKLCRRWKDLWSPGVWGRGREEEVNASIHVSPS